MEHRNVYFDNNATTPLHPGVKEALIEGLEIFGNPSSMHGFGREARERIEEARAKVASFIGADADEILFVGSGSEANNTVLSLLHCDSTRCTCALSGRSGLVTTAIEHPCVLNTARDLGRKKHEVTYLAVDKYGRIDLDDLRRSVTDKVGMVSIMMANNEIGTIQDIKTAARIALEHQEAWDGSGYPSGLKGEEIHVFSRIARVVDVLDCLLSRRVYKEPWSVPEALAHLGEQRGRMFDPGLVDTLLRHQEEFLSLREEIIQQTRDVEMGEIEKKP